MSSKINQTTRNFSVIEKKIFRSEPLKYVALDKNKKAALLRVFKKTTQCKSKFFIYTSFFMKKKHTNKLFFFSVEAKKFKL